MLFEKQPQCVIKVLSARKHGEPKLKKPKELDGIEQAFSVDWIPEKCKCPCYIVGNDIYIKHRDFNSIELYGTDYEFRRKFIYKDEYGCIVLRGEAWLVIKNIYQDIKNNILLPKISFVLAEQITDVAGHMEWERFFEKVIVNAQRYYKEGNKC